jgi:hypothetical protein
MVNRDDRDKTRTNSEPSRAWPDEEIRVLRFLDDIARPVSFAELARILPDRKSALRELLAALERDALIETATCEAGELATITREGRAARRRVDGR